MSDSANSVHPVRTIDHVVLPAVDLETARNRLTALGFTVAPDGRHPFGTENACVYFPDGTFLEPLAVAQREDCEASAREGNVFTARDQAFRFRNGEDGFSAVAFATEDAKGDHDIFARSGVSAGELLAFSRAVVTRKGEAGQARFLLAFAADLRSPDAFFFTCERLKVPEVDYTALETHPNGATRLVEVVLSEQNPTDFQYFLQCVSGNRTTEAHSFGLEVETSRRKLNVMTPEGLRVHFGVSRKSVERGLRFEGLVLSVPSLDAAKRVLDENEVSYRSSSIDIIVDVAPGQGSFIAFREHKG
ncbi:VOC family protein [Oricola cellulosilytica]|uniref:VOC family protein n=1 Tax=Oricola cellulosilytica TaxID=1429082 RepID=A0A4R0PAY5_9HYPH|nr:VOC family protein [Oricola cellulosilytica]TCD13128.1 VOC family protein [Oricola cellulosilytica]